MADGPLFIVDNSVSGWTGLRYLREWSRAREQLRHRDRLLRDRLAARARRQVAEARQDPDPDGRRGHARDQEGRVARGGQASAPRTRSTRASRPRRSATRSSTACRRSSRRCRVGPDRVPRLHQGQVPREGVHHARASSRSSAPRRSSARATSPGPGLTQNVELNIQVAERSRGRAAPGVVRGALEARPTTSRRTSSRSIERHAREYSPVRGLREGAARVLPRPRADGRASGTRPARRCSRRSTATRRRRTGR